MSKELKKISIGRWALALGLGAALTLGAAPASAQVIPYDPSKIIEAGPENCAQCHEKTVQAWKESTHNRTYEELHKRDEAKTILENMGESGSIRRNDECVPRRCDPDFGVRELQCTARVRHRTAWYLPTQHDTGRAICT